MASMHETTPSPWFITYWTKSAAPFLREAAQRTNLGVEIRETDRVLQGYDNVRKTLVESRPVVEIWFTLGGDKTAFWKMAKELEEKSKKSTH